MNPTLSGIKDRHGKPPREHGLSGQKIAGYSGRMLQHQFRLDINGLRAVAVISIILFHFGNKWIGGGFLGVDVFFVISGYLITGSILRDLEARRFTFLNFYYKRARRLIPAMLVVVAASLAIGAIGLPPLYFLGLGKSAIAALSWVSNFYFWNDAGYFSADAFTKPLLHTWSLGVEEQFYLVWPPLIFMSYRFFGRTGVFVSIAAMFLGGLSASEWTAGAFPITAFFLTPFRVFEFAAGGIVIFSEHRFDLPRWGKEIVTTAALAVMIYCFLHFTDKSKLPGLLALPVVIATVAIIQTKGSRLAGYILTNPISTLIGKISYSLYLVHWPIIVFYRYAVFRNISPVEQAWLCAAMILLAWLLYETIEQEGLRYYWLAREARPARLGAFALWALVIAAAGIVWSGQGLASRSNRYFSPGFLDAQYTRKLTDITAVCATREVNHCWDVVPTTKKRVLILGDSKSGDGFNMIMPSLGSDYIIMNGYPGCAPYAPSSDLAKLGWLAPCTALNKKRLDPTYLRAFDIIVISVAWGWYSHGELHQTIEAIRAANPQAKLIVFGDYYVLKIPCWQIIEHDGVNDCFDEKYIDTRFLDDDELKSTAKKDDFLFISMKDALCDTKGLNCRASTGGTPDIPFSWDGRHANYEFAHIGLHPVPKTPS